MRSKSLPPLHSLGWCSPVLRGEHPYSQHPPPFWVGGRGRVPPQGGERVSGGTTAFPGCPVHYVLAMAFPSEPARPHRGNVGRSVRCQTAAEEETIPSEAYVTSCMTCCARGDLVCFRRSWTQKQKQNQGVPGERRDGHLLEAQAGGEPLVPEHRLRKGGPSVVYMYVLCAYRIPVARLGSLIVSWRT